MRTAQPTETATILDRLRQHGFAVAHALVPQRLLGDLTAEADAMIYRFTQHSYRSTDFWCYEVDGQELPMLYRIHNLDKQGAPRIAALFVGGVLHKLADSLLGCAAATVCAMIVKTPGVAGVPWHRDRTDVPPLASLNLSVFLDRSTKENGCFEAVPGSHLLPDGIDVEQTRADGPRAAVPAEPGDVLIHDVRLVHGSGDNGTATIRRSIIIEYTAKTADEVVS